VAPELVDLFVAIADPGGSRPAFALTRQARGAGLAAQLELAGRSLKGQLKHADRIGARYVAIVNDSAGTTSLKNMESGEQRDLRLAEVIPTILRGSRLS
jgi:histidyl-tRNA synthetase